MRKQMRIKREIKQQSIRINKRVNPVVRSALKRDQLDRRKNACTIIVPHVNTIHYLRGCISQIRNHKHPEIDQKIVIVDQSNKEIGQSVLNEYLNQPDIVVVTAPQIDAGYPIDLGLNYADTEYYCSLDCDAFPIHDNWLYLPIKLIEKYKFSFVGTDTGLSQSYTHKGKFTHINNYFRVSKTHIAQFISDSIGFMKPKHRERVGFIPGDRYNGWGKEECDNGVAAQWYSDRKNLGDKFSFGINKKLGFTNKMGLYGIIVDDLIFHMVFGWGEDWIEDLQDVLGSDYLKIREEIQKKPIDEEVINNLVERCVSHNHPRAINGKNIPDHIDEFVESMKKG